MKFLRNQTFTLMLTLLAGFGLGLAYSWLISPVTYVDANPSILRADFKDHYRIAIAASYASTHNLPRARARLDLLGDNDPIGELSAQAQRMLAANESFERVRPLAQLATDLQQGFASVPFTNTPPVGIIITPVIDTPFAQEPFITETAAGDIEIITAPEFDQTPLTPLDFVTPTPGNAAAQTQEPSSNPPFILVGQDNICDSAAQQNLLQFILMDSRRRQISGVKIIVTWDQGEDRFFTGFKPEIGNGYADFLMEENVYYSARIVDGGAFVPTITAPTCTDSNGAAYTGGLLLTFQR